MKNKKSKKCPFDGNDFPQTDAAPAPDFPPEVCEEIIKNVMTAVRKIGPLRKRSQKSDDVGPDGIS
jgi:hypothetical protein